MKQIKLPNFIIAGVNKAGTTSVFQYLNFHPQVCCSGDKETGYFLPARYGAQLEPIQVYKEQFLNYNDEQIIMEATPGYFYGGKAIAETIRETVQKDCKILIVLREPVSRLISFYRAKKKSLELDRNIDFKAYVETCLAMKDKELNLRENNKFTGILCGYYINFIEDWFAVFGNNLKIVFYDELNSDPKKFINELCQWLDLDAKIYDDYNFEIENKTFAYKNKFIQRMAINVNRGASRFWRQNPKIKRWIRKQYFKINRSEKEELIHRETMTMVENLYSPFNLKLKNFLIEKGVKNLPGWLANS